jgi:hypothetical protein
MSLLKAIKIEFERFRIGSKQRPSVVSALRATPNGLFPIQHVVHLPVAALQTGRFGSQGGIASDLMHREWKICERLTAHADDPL